jgi:hypothetical protein
MLNVKEYDGSCNIPFKTICELHGKFMERESLQLQWRMKISQKLPSEFETKLIEFQCVLLLD